MLTKNQRIKTVRPVNGMLKEGVVLSVKDGKIMAVMDDGTLLKGGEGAFVASNSPTPPQFLLRKRDRVEWTDGRTGEKLFGVVESRLTAAFKVVADGGLYVHTIPIGEVFPSMEPLARDTKATPMDCYEVRKFKPVKELSEETQAFSAEIWKDGEAILHASNDGQGGGNRYYPLGQHNRGVMDQAYSDARQWIFVLTGKDDPMEPLDLWISWAGNEKSFGVTAEQYLRNFYGGIDEVLKNDAPTEEEGGVVA